ncbi:helix-turn-helix domain-containing protein [Paracoccus sp. TOH]|uniref:helix-turn-helix transcriptional regulator n=1 Tax=Paracoccus sp. TOH TaxID=1263728 RepID=UPI0025B04149|nr:helix-turn-helix domain-containing protein [Paracoccus sp. TOH]WJS84224.1 helix-turn-helix domain-containing protein [Paracoccus sp. TOH]
MANNQCGSGPELYYSIPAAARILGVPKYTLYRAVKAGLLPCHLPFSSRRRVLLSEVRAAMAAYMQAEVQQDQADVG